MVRFVARLLSRRTAAAALLAGMLVALLAAVEPFPSPIAGQEPGSTVPRAPIVGIASVERAPAPLPIVGAPAPQALPRTGVADAGRSSIPTPILAPAAALLALLGVAFAGRALRRAAVTVK
ncbi:MAG: hypothetical protein U0531_18430 [Dehalococcoidia bacterium]